MAAYKIILWFSKHKTINGLCPVISQIWGDFFLNPKKGQESTNDSVRTERTTRQYYHMPHLTRMLENVKTKKSLIELRKVLRLIIIWPCNGLLMILCFQPKPKLSFEIRKSCAVLRGSMQFWQRYCYTVSEFEWNSEAQSGKTREDNHDWNFPKKWITDSFWIWWCEITSSASLRLVGMHIRVMKMFTRGLRLVTSHFLRGSH